VALHRLFTTRGARRRGPGAPRARRGFLLLDTLLALMTAVMLIVYSLSLMMTAASGADAAKQSVIAYNAARQVVENLRLRKGAGLYDGTYDATVFGPMPQLSLLNGGAATVKISDSGWSGTVKMAQVSVNWHSGGRSQPKSRTLTAIFTSGGVAP
jgi:type II secretory pathway pseudopilin PulG